MIFKHIDKSIRENDRELKSLDQEFANEVKQLTAVQVSYGYGDDLRAAASSSLGAQYFCRYILCQSGFHLKSVMVFFFFFLF